MQALILAGGQGTRLRPLTLDTPKPVLPICNRPFLTYQFELLKRAGITDITLCLNYQPNKIRRIIGNGSKYGVNLRYVVEPEPRGTAGAIKYAEKFIEGTTIVLNGDSLIDFDLTKAIRKHRSCKTIATIVLTKVKDTSLYGLVLTNSDGRVKRFLEKSKRNQYSNNTINAGVYLLEKDLLKLIPKDKYSMLEKDVFPSLLKKHIPVFSYTPSKPYWIDIGTPLNFLQTNLDFINNKTTLFPNSSKSGESELITNLAGKAVVGEGCMIDPDVSIINSVIGDQCRIFSGVSIRDSVVFSNSIISNESKIHSSIIGKGCSIGRICVLMNSVVGNKSSITDYSILNSLLSD
jgi:NDP-sugar pyrophosphorylase family protein